MRFSDAGLWLSYAAVAPDTADAVTEILKTELERLRTEPVPAEELARAKSRIRGSWILGLESNANRATRLANTVLAGRPVLSPDVILERLGTVDADAELAAAARCSAAEQTNLVTVGPERTDGLCPAPDAAVRS